MKRKSILMTIVAVLFAGVAIGQIITPWPTTLGSGVKAADTIYFCERAETQFPIELGYDVSGRNLHPSYGNWSLVSKTSSSVTAIDYDTDVNVKNGGAGNAYKTVGSGKGGLLFQYNATNDLCGLGVGEKYWVYVFILPSESDIVYRDTLFCKDPSASTDTEIDFGAVFKEYIDLFKSVGFTGIGTDIKWLHGTGTGKQTASIKVPNIIPLQDTLVLAPGGSPKGKYDCGDTITFKVVVQVKDTISLTARGKHLCFDDTLSYLQGKTLSELFGREGVPGSYAASPALLPWGGTNVEKKLFTFTYKTCKVSPAAETETVTDTLYLHASSPVTGSYWGKDSLTFCRLASTVDIYKLLDLTTSAKPGITLGNSYWYDRNLGKFDFAPPGKNYATISGTSSIGIDTTFKGAAHYAEYAHTNEVNIADLKSNVKYHYLWAVDPGALPCFTSTNGTPDSGTLILIVQDPAIAQDYTSQLCLTSYIDGSHDFDLNLYAGLNVKWAPVSSPALKTDAVLEVNNVKPGTYKYKYAIEPGCGPGGTGVFYIKVTNKINAASKTVKYCLEKLPASINANDILGVGISSLNWTSTAAGGFNTTTGILEISEFVKAKGNIVDGDSVTFTVGSGTPACGVAAGTTVTIQFVSNLN